MRDHVRPLRYLEKYCPMDCPLSSYSVSTLFPVDENARCGVLGFSSFIRPLVDHSSNLTLR